MAVPPNPIASMIMQQLTTQGTLLMKMRILSLGKNYDVMDTNHRVLCQIGLDAGQNISGQMLGSAVAQFGGDYLGRYAQRSLSYTYIVRDAQGQPALEIRKEPGGNKADFRIVDPQSNALLGTIHLQRSLFGGLKASWISPQGQTFLQSKGNIIRRKYELLGPDGRSVGRVRHKILAIRDVWQLELDAQANHLYAALFATVLDFEKKM
jgi:uncharacterized protein YxjI